MSEENTQQENILIRMGPMRIALWVFVLITWPFALEQGEYGSNWYILSTYVMPALVILLAWGILLDVLMCFIYRAGRPEQRSMYNGLLLVHLCALSVLCWIWWPYFSALLS